MTSAPECQPYVAYGTTRHPNSAIARSRVGLRITRVRQVILTGRRYHTFPMGYYLLEYALVDDYLARRAAFREVHLALAREAHRRGELILAGALAEPTDRAVLVWRTDDLIERFSFGGPTIAPLLSASLTAILTFTTAWSPHGPSTPGLSSSAREADMTPGHW
jgi:uncharacterized protein